MCQKYGEPVYILITKKADPASYPNGTWFDNFIDSPMQVTGIDEDKKLYILDGKTIPFSCAELLSWGPPVIRSADMVAMVDEIYQEKRTASQQEILSLLRLAFPNLPDDAELIISQLDPFIFADDTILWLEKHRYQVGDYKVIFTAGVREVKTGKFGVVAMENSKGSCITVLKTTL